MSKTYAVKKGDMLGNISISFYGTFSKWTKIRTANPQIEGRGKAIDGSPLIFPGDILIIPDDLELKPASTTTTINAKSDELTIIIEGNKFSYFTDYTLKQSMDSFDSFGFSAPFDPDIQIYRESFRPFSYKPCQVYYAGNLFFSGILLAPQADGKDIKISGYPKCGVLVDCQVPITKYPLEFNNQDLKKISENIASAYNINVNFSESSGSIFPKVAIEPEQNIMDFLIGLANQIMFLITNNAQGDLLFWKTQKGSSVANIKEGDIPYISCRPTFNYQEYYSHIIGLKKADSKTKAEKYVWENKFLISKGILRSHTFLASDAESGDLKTAVMAKAGRMFASSCSYQLTLQGLKNQNKELWAKNTLINVLSKEAMIYKDTQFLIKNAEISRSSDKGDSTVLDLVLPGSFSGEIPEALPWEE